MLLTILITILTFLLIMVGLLMVVVILMQRPSADAGMGAAFGGGAAEAAFGANTANVLTKATRWTGTSFVLLCLILYLLHIHQAAQAEVPEADPGVPVFEEELAPPPTDADAPLAPLPPAPARDAFGDEAPAEAEDEPEEALRDGFAPAAEAAPDDESTPGASPE